MTQPRILMCRPDFYGIEYEINAWMHRDRPSDQARCVRAMVGVEDACIEAAGATIETLPPVAGLPDLVFTANAAIVHRDLAIVAHFRHAERQGEEPHDAAGWRRTAFALSTCPTALHFEGAGDALFCGDTLFAGYRLRSEARAHQWVGQRLGCRVIPLELVDPYYYHLDTCFCPLAPGVAVYYPAAFDAVCGGGAARAGAGVDRGQPGRSAALRLQRRGGRQDGDHEHRLPGAAPGTGGARVTRRVKRRSTNSSKPAAARNA